MRYSLEPKYRRYVKGYRFLSFARAFGDKYGKKYGRKIMDIEIKTGLDAAKTASKRVVQKAIEATGDLIWDKIISASSRSKRKEKEDESKRFIFHQKKDGLRLF